MFYKNDDNLTRRYAIIMIVMIAIVFEFILSKLVRDVSVSFQLHLCLIGLVIIIIFDEIQMRIVFNKYGSRRAKGK